MPLRFRRLLLTGLVEESEPQARHFFQTLMFISESGLLRYARLAFCAATVAALSTTSSPGKQSSNQPAAPVQTSKLDTTTGFRGQKFGTSFSEFPGLTVEKDEGDLKLYTKGREPPTWARQARNGCLSLLPRQVLWGFTAHPGS